MADKEIHLLLLEDSVGDARLVCEMLSAAENDTFRIYCAENLLTALEALAHTSFDIALVDLSLPDSQGLATFETVHRHAPALPVVIMTGLASEQLALAAMERGAQEYLVKGRINTQALVRVLQYAMARSQTLALSTAVENAAPSKTIGIMGAKGGVGCTTLAASFSVELARQSAGKTLLVDLDPTAASTAFLLRTQSNYSIADAAQNLHRLDSDYWAGVVAHAHGIEVLQASGAVDGAEVPPSERVRHVLRFARGLYANIVVDLGRLNAYSASLLGELDELYLVVTPSLPEIYEAGRALRKLPDAGVAAAHTRVVFNRFSRCGQPTMAAFEEALNRQSYYTIPDCGRELDDGYAAGRFMDERSQFRKHAVRLVAKSLGTEEQPQKRGGLLSMLGLSNA
jgi:Flp pilus assembly CpaE family ATPase